MAELEESIDVGQSLLLSVSDVGMNALTSTPSEITPKAKKGQKSSDSEKASKNIYFHYDPNNFMPMSFFRPPGDVVASAIIHSSSEGIGRYEIGRKLCINTRTKRGNRKVSALIMQLEKEYPEKIGHYQKVDGKYRMLKYYMKSEASEPGNMQKLLDNFEEVAGVPLPYKISDIVKFPGTKFNTLRINDVSIKRFIYLLEFIKQERVIVTISRVVKHIQEREADEGYNFQVDKKSVMKCLLALERKSLCHMYQTDIQAEDMVHKNFEVVTVSEITSLDCKEVRESIARTIATFHSENRIFPTGQPRVYTHHQTVEAARMDGFDVDKVDYNHMSIEERYKLMRLITFHGHSREIKEEMEDESRMETSMEVEKQETQSQVPEEEISIMQTPTEFEEFEILQPETQEQANRLAIPNFAQALAEIKIKQPGHGSFDNSVNYGFQSGKMIRSFIIHEFAWYFVYNRPRPRPSGLEMPSYFDRFPPGSRLPDEGTPFEVLEGTSLEDTLVYDTTIDSPFRYVPPLPLYRDVQHGWVMIRDLLGAMPLSIYVLIFKKMTYFPEIFEYLEHPLKRHMLISDLPVKLRNALLNKKVIAYLDHICILLCAFGLMRAGKALDGGRHANFSSSFFFVGKQAVITDTSTSQKGYAKVTPPMEQYITYTYQFNELTDVHAYWNHFKAIAQSTQLGSKDAKSEQEEKELMSSRKYALGSMDRKPHEVSYDKEIDKIYPAVPREGCAGMDPVLFVHLKRHWDVDRNKYSEWWLNRALRYAEFVRPILDGRVGNAHKVWSNLMSFMSSESQYYKKKGLESILSHQTIRALRLGTIGKKRKKLPNKKDTSKLKMVEMPNYESGYEYLLPPNQDDSNHFDDSNLGEDAGMETDFDPEMAGPSTSGTNTNEVLTLAEVLSQLEKQDQKVQNTLKSQGRLPFQPELESPTKQPGSKLRSKKKRKLDEIDIISQRRAVKIRSQFTPKEKDYLIMIRAVSFFLNPVYRFWLDPVVVRDIMHEYVAESRTKTVDSLMAAAVREMGKPHRLTHLQYLVKTLSSYKQMREIRIKLSSSNFDDAIEKKKFFHSAFEVAHRVLFQDVQHVPSWHASDETFFGYLAQRKVEYTTKDTLERPMVPERSQKPRTIDHIQHCVAFNAIMMLFLNDTKFSDTETEEAQVLSQLIDRVSPSAITSVLDRLRSDGLISQIKPTSDDSNMPRHAASLSLYYRHFFNHRYRNELVDLTKNAREMIQSHGQAGVSLTGEDDPGVLYTLSDYLINDEKCNVNVKLPESILDVFEGQVDLAFLSNEEKFLANKTKQLRYLEDTNLRVEKIQVVPTDIRKPEDLISLEELISQMVPKVPMAAVENPPNLDQILSWFDSDDHGEVRSLMLILNASNVMGKSIPELEKEVQYDSKNIVTRILDKLIQEHVVFECGIECHRYVLMKYAKCWMMTTKDYGFFIRPWCNINGDVNPVILRWMIEGVLFTIESKPKIPLTELESMFDFVLQPVHLHELLAVLERIGAVQQVSEFLKTLKKKSPFSDDESIKEVIKYIQPIKNGVERFARIFSSIEIPDYLYLNVRKQFDS